MKSKKDWMGARQSLRTQAESLLVGIPAPHPQAPPVDVMLHELLVHKVELEMQVEELRRAHDAMEEARDRYLEFYEFAPVGYITLNLDGLITEINPAGADLLGVERSKPSLGRFTDFVAPDDQDFWHRLFINLIRQAEPGKPECVLELVRKDGSKVHAYLNGQLRLGNDHAPVVRLALLDIGKVSTAEQQMRLTAAGSATLLDRLVHHD
jgi:PAS domain S-box-containing protein